MNIVSNNSSTKKSVKRARSANANGNKPRPSTTKRGSRKLGDSQNIGRGVNAPIAHSAPVRVSGPQISQSLDSCRVINRELIGPILSTSPASQFQVTNRFRCNPASERTFAWLSTMARSWESYKFRKLRFILIGRCPTTVAGSVIMSPDYDAQDGQPTTEQQMGQFKGTVEDVPWAVMKLDLNPKYMNRLYKAHVTMDDARFDATSQDEKTIDCAQVFIGNDVNAALTLGKLWVEYDVELTTPQTPQVLPSSGGAVFTAPTTTAGGQVVRTTNLPGVLRSDLQDPIIEDSIFNKLTVGQGELVRFLRDWQGDFSVSCNTTTNNAFSAFPPLSKKGADGVISAITSNDQTGGALDNLFSNINGNFPASGYYNSVKTFLNQQFKQGDELLLGSDTNSGWPYSVLPVSAAVSLILGGQRYV